MDNSLSQTKEILAWLFLPPLLTNVTLRTFYFLTNCRPQISATPTQLEANEYNNRNYRHNRNARVTLITLYLLYILLNCYFTQRQGYNKNFYHLLDIDREFVIGQNGIATLKSHFRTLAKMYHPDKGGNNSSEHFIALRAASDALSSTQSGLRHAYELFGADVLNWGKLSGEREWLTRAATVKLPFYIFTSIALYVFGWLGQVDERITFYRYLSLLLLATTELSIVLSPPYSDADPTWLSVFLPDRLPFQHIEFLHQLYTSSIFASAQILPYFLFTPPSPEQLAQTQIAETNSILEGIKQTQAAISNELNEMQGLIISSLLEFPKDPITVAELSRVNQLNETLSSEITNQMLRSYADQSIQLAPTKIWDTVTQDVRLRVPPASPPRQFIRKSPSVRLISKSIPASTAISSPTKPRSNSIGSVVGGDDDFRSAALSPTEMNGNKVLEAEISVVELESEREIVREVIGVDGEVVHLD